MCSYLNADYRIQAAWLSTQARESNVTARSIPRHTCSSLAVDDLACICCRQRYP
jgi:hypothetical protein